MLVLPPDGELRTLVHAAQRQSPPAFAALYDLFAAPLLRYFRCGVADMQRAEALVTHTFLSLIDAIREVRLPRRSAALLFVGWLYQFAARHFEAWLACQPHGREPAARTGGDVSDDNGQRAWSLAHGQFSDAFGWLTAEQQVVVVLRCVERFTLPQVAVSLGLSETHIARAQHQGLAVLSERVQPA